MRILTNRLGSAASARAAVEPVIPTDTPHRRLHIPTVNPPQKIAKPIIHGVSYGQKIMMGRKVEQTREIVLSSVQSILRHECEFGGINDTHDLEISTEHVSFEVDLAIYHSRIWDVRRHRLRRPRKR